jgi:hypothetical protein
MKIWCIRRALLAALAINVCLGSITAETIMYVPGIQGVTSPNYSSIQLAIDAMPTCGCYKTIYLTADVSEGQINVNKNNIWIDGAWDNYGTIPRVTHTLTLTNSSYFGIVVSGNYCEFHNINLYLVSAVEAVWVYGSTSYFYNVNFSSADNGAHSTGADFSGNGGYHGGMLHCYFGYIGNAVRCYDCEQFQLWGSTLWNYQNGVSAELTASSNKNGNLLFYLNNTYIGYADEALSPSIVWLRGWNDRKSNATVQSNHDLKLIAPSGNSYPIYLNGNSNVWLLDNNYTGCPTNNQRWHRMDNTDVVNNYGNDNGCVVGN